MLALSTPSGGLPSPPKRCEVIAKASSCDPCHVDDPAFRRSSRARDKVRYDPTHELIEQGDREANVAVRRRIYHPFLHKRSARGTGLRHGRAEHIGHIRCPLSAGAKLGERTHVDALGGRTTIIVHSKKAFIERLVRLVGGIEDIGPCD